MDETIIEASSAIPWTDSADVVVVGGGGTGLSAAIEAATRNVSVILLEKNPDLGGTTAIAIGSVSAAGTSLQRSRGIDDSPKAYLQDLAKVTPHNEHRNNQELRKVLALEAANTIEWLKDLGTAFFGPFPDSHNPVPRMHIIVPGTVACIKNLQKVAVARGCRISTACEVKRLVQDERGATVGVVSVNRKNLKAEAIRAKRGVILASGDYSNNLDLKQRFFPKGVTEIEAINESSTGDGHRLGMDAGADVVNMDMFHGPELRFVLGKKRLLKNRLPSSALISRIMAAGLGILPKSLLTYFAKEMLVSWQRPENSFFTKGTILINSRGERFTDEAQAPEREIAAARQPGKVVFLVFDDIIAQQFSHWPNFVSTAPGIAYAYLDDYRHFRPDIFFQAQNIEDLADHFGLPPVQLKQTVEDYNHTIEGKRKDPWGRKIFAAPLSKPPFYIMGPAKAFMTTTDGGLKINSRFEVLRKDGKSIPGLFAAGPTGQGGLVHSSHGTGLSWAFTSGRLAGKYAAGGVVRN